MMKQLITLALSLFALSSAAAWAGPMEDLDAAMQPIAAKLVSIDKVLAADSTEGVQAAASAIAELSAKLKTEGLTGEDGKKLVGIEEKIQTAARAMAAAESIEGQRAALKELSKPIALWATLRQPEGIHVAYCPMASASWLQDETKVSNPYYGASMLRCGQIVERSDKPATEGGEHAGHQGH